MRFGSRGRTVLMSALFGLAVIGGAVAAIRSRRPPRVLSARELLSPPRSADDRQLYQLGVQLASRLEGFSLSPREAEIVASGLLDASGGRALVVDGAPRSATLLELERRRAASRLERAHAVGDTFRVAESRVSGSETLDSGVVYREIHPGSGPVPNAQDNLTIEFTGTLPDGVVFDTSRAQGGTYRVRIANALPCWAIALRRMHVGSQSHVVCPPSTAFGDRPQRTVPPGATVAFDLTLVSIEQQSADIRAPVGVINQ